MASKIRLSDSHDGEKSKNRREKSLATVFLVTGALTAPD
jgi:hypothetical protein